MGYKMYCCSKKQNRNTAQVFAYNDITAAVLIKRRQPVKTVASGFPIMLKYILSNLKLQHF